MGNTVSDQEGKSLCKVESPCYTCNMPRNIEKNLSENNFLISYQSTTSKRDLLSRNTSFSLYSSNSSKSSRKIMECQLSEKDVYENYAIYSSGKTQECSSDTDFGTSCDSAKSYDSFDRSSSHSLDNVETQVKKAIEVRFLLHQLCSIYICSNLYDLVQIEKYQKEAEFASLTAEELDRRSQEAINHNVIKCKYLNSLYQTFKLANDYATLREFNEFNKERTTTYAEFEDIPRNTEIQATKVRPSSCPITNAFRRRRALKVQQTESDKRQNKLFRSPMDEVVMG
jgi:hypothetical protein